MKSVNNKVRNVLTVILVILLVVLSNYSFAGTAEGKTNATPVTVKYVGSINSQDLIQVEIENGNEEVFEISFVDGDGIVLYTETFSSKKISKKFLLDVADLELKNLNLVVKSKKTFQTQMFSIAKESNIVENLVIAKVK